MRSPSPHYQKEIKGLTYPGVTVVFFCHDGEGHYVLSKRGPNCRDEHGAWDPGAGSLDFGEKVEDALAREIKEEYGTNILAHEFLGYMDLHRSHQGQPTHWIALVFKVLVDRKKVLNNEPNKFDAVDWFSLSALPQPLHSQFPHALALFGSKL